jgi:hypothetical protein
LPDVLSDSSFGAPRPSALLDEDGLKGIVLVSFRRVTERAPSPAAAA